MELWDYGLRPWIESGYKDFKRGGWQWQQTRIEDPLRAERLWLALAVATLWVVSVGGEAAAHLPPSSWADLPPTHVARQHPPRPDPPRLLSCFQRGLITLLAHLLRGRLLPVAPFYPEPWPASHACRDPVLVS